MFIEIVDQIIALLRDRERISYRVLKREFALDDEQLEDIEEELIDDQRVAMDENGNVLVWADSLASSIQSLESEKPRPIIMGQTQDPRPSGSRPSDPNPQPLIAYAPAHLADRIRVVAVTDGERKCRSRYF